METIRPEELYVSLDHGGLEYIVDDSGVYWYDYDKLMKILFISSNQKEKYYNFINDYDKCIFNVLSKFKSQDQRKRFITTKAVCSIINKQNERGNEILLKIINNESNDSYEHLEFKEELKQLYTNIEMCNDVYVCQSIHKLSNMNHYKEIMDKYDSNYDKEKEELIDLLREDLYNYDDYIDEVEITMVTRRNEDDFYFKQNYYEKRKKENKCSTAPSWLKNVVK